MKNFVIKFYIALALLIAQPCFATTHYVDLTSGNDGTADGTTTLPYLTIAAADDGLSGGDEIRLKKTAVSTASDTMDWTNGSATVATDSDETGNISVGDVICMTSDFSDNEGWWYVDAIDGSSITLDCPYTGVTAANATTYYMEPATDNGQQLTSDGSSISSMLKLTGGWDFSTETRDGFTYWRATNSASALMFNNADYIELGYVVLASTASTTYESLELYISDFLDVHDIYIAGITGKGMYLWNINYHLMLDKIIATCGSAHSHFDFSAMRFGVAENVYSYGCNYTGGAINIGGYNLVIDTFEILDSAGDGVVLQTSEGIIVQNGTINTTVDDGVVFMGDSHSANIANIEFISIGDDAFNAAYGSKMNQVHNPTFTSVTGDEFTISATSQVTVPQILYVDGSYNHSERAGSWTRGSDTAQARSGTCLYIDDNHSGNNPIPTPVGMIKVSSTAANINLKIYLKEDGSFNGQVYLAARQDGELVDLWALQTITSSYVQKTVEVASGDLRNGAYLELMAFVRGGAGTVYFDDFSYSQP